MASNLEYGKLVSLAGAGGYSLVTRLSELTGVFLLSACWVLRMRYLWQTPLMKISDAEYEQIIEMIEQAEYELMTSFAIGQIISTVSDVSSNDSLLLLDGSAHSQLDYPELANVVPPSWLSGSDIILPNMTEKGVFGENGDVGDVIGENAVQLSVGQIPSHTHVQESHSHSEVAPVVSPALGGEIPATASLVTTLASVTGGTIAINQNTGGDESHNNIQESLSVYWWIVAA